MHFEKLKKVKRPKPNGKTIILLFVSFCILISSCYEQREGCLDPTATNFDPSADLNVNCRYPQLTLNFDANGPNEGLSYDSIYFDEEGTPYQISFAGIFLQPFRIQVDQNWRDLSDKRYLVTLDDESEIEFAEDVSLLEPRTFTNVIDEVRIFEAFTAINLTVGLGSIGNIDSMNIPQGSALGLKDEMIGEGEIYDYVLVIDKDTSDAIDSYTLNGRLSNPQVIQFNIQGVIEPAVDFNWILEVYYNEWLSVLNLSDAHTIQQQRLESNLQDVFSIVIP